MTKYLKPQNLFEAQFSFFAIFDRNLELMGYNG